MVFAEDAEHAAGGDGAVLGGVADKPIAGAADAEKVAGIGRIGLKIFAQPHDKIVDGPRAFDVGLMPHPLDQFVATPHELPVVTTHAVAVHATFSRPVSREQAWEVLRMAPGVVVADDPETGEFPTPVDVVGTDPSWVGRVRQSLDDPRTIELFVCGDNLRKGAALNTAQIAEVVAAELTGRL